MVTGENFIGETLCKDSRINLVSFTGSTTVGKLVAQNVQARFGKVYFTEIVLYFKIYFNDLYFENVYILRPFLNLVEIMPLLLTKMQI